MTDLSVFSRRRMYGRTSARSGAYGLCGCDESRLVNVENALPDPSRPGLRKSKMDQRSPSRFSTGVPLSAMRARASICLAARVCLAPGVLIACASSRMARRHGVASSAGTRSSDP